MTIQEYFCLRDKSRDHIAAGKPVINGNEAHIFMHKASQDAIRITMEINKSTTTFKRLQKSRRTTKTVL